MHTALSSHFGARAQLTFLPWSGANRHGARSQAAQALREKLANDAAVDTNARHYVIAHSHGGNVAVMACGDAETKARVAGLCCIGTPFIKYRRNFSADTILSYGGFLWLTFLVFASGFFISDRTGMDYDVVMGSLMMFCFIAAMVFVRFSPWDREDFSFPELDASRILVIRSLADEASGVLQMASFLQWVLLAIISFLLQTTYNWYDFLYKTWPGRLVFLNCFVIPAIFATIGMNTPGFLPDLVVSLFWTVALLVSAGPMFVMGLFSAVAWPIRFLLLLAYGWDVPHRAFSYRVSAEATPQGFWSVLTVDPGSTQVSLSKSKIAASGTMFAEPMMHNETFEHPDAISAIIEWIEQLEQHRIASGDIKQAT